jgi:hypothetical protein
MAFFLGNKKATLGRVAEIVMDRLGLRDLASNFLLADFLDCELT